MASVAIWNGRALGHWRRWAPVAVLVGLCLVVGFINPSFFTTGNAVRMLNTAAIPLVVCMGATFIILMGSIDLSVSQPGQRGGDRFEVVLVMIAQTKGWFRWRGGRELRSSNEQISTVAVPVASVGFYL